MANREVLEGSRINDLYIEEYIGQNKYRCKCLLCGSTRDCRSYELKQGKYKACKICESSERNKVDNIINKEIGYWKVLEYLGNKQYRCLCTRCNREYKVYKNNLVTNKSKSCENCSQELKLQIDFTKEVFESGKVIKYLSKSIWLCECGLCNTQLNRSTTSLKKTKKILCNICHGKDYRTKLENTTINKWSVLEYLGEQKYLCRCNNCNKVTEVSTYNLTSGHSKSCGCTLLKDLKNKTINEWTVIEYSGEGYWKCRCSCGTERQVHGYELRSNRAKSCGCKKWEYARKTLLERYNEVAPVRINNNRSNYQIEALVSKDKLEEFIKGLGYKPTTFELSKELDISVSTILKTVHKYGLEELVDIGSKISRQHTEILEVISKYTNNIIIDDRSILNGKELDIYLPEYKLAIEINGMLWHSTIYKDKHYHQQKTIACAKQGIRLIHIFEYEWNDVETREKIIRLLDSILSKDKKAVYARETEIKQISNSECTDFLDIHHLQGSVISSIRIGCFYKNELIGVMTFGKPRFNTGYDYELHRLCWNSKVKVIGGAEKLFSYFIKNYNPQSIITYSDISKFTGNVYTKLEFKPIQPKPITEPNYVWVSEIISGIYETLSRYQTQKHRLIELGLGTEEQTEDEIMEELGYFKIYDSGNIKLEWYSN